MPRLSKSYRTLWGLSGNPFPDHAIASAGDESRPFYENLYPGIGRKMERAFLGVNGAAPKVAFFWSLGSGEEARGYGKTRHLLWFAERLNADLGRSRASVAPPGSEGGGSLAAYAAFTTVEGLSLSNLLFDAVKDLARARGQQLVALRALELARGRTPEVMYESAAKRLASCGESWAPGLLRLLCSEGPESWVQYLDGFSSWHTVRYGRQMLRSCVAFLLELRIDRLLLLVDQVEDFASYTTPTYKLRRDFERLGYLCSGDRLLSAHATFVLTMHPRAARVLSSYWPEAALGPVSAAETAANVVQLGAMSQARFLRLVSTYLEAARIEPPRDRLHPFKEGSIELVYELERGRPGHCLQQLCALMDLAAAARHRSIEKAFVESCLMEDPQRG